MRKTLVSFSGGLDSTYIMWRLLSETDDEVTACFLDARLATPEKNGDHIPGFRHTHQQICAENVINWLRTNVRDCGFYKQNIYEIKDDELILIWFSRYSARLANQNKYDRFMDGLAGLLDGGLRKRIITGEYYKIANRGTYEQPIGVYGDWKIDIPHQMDQLPKELQELTISCLDVSLGEGRTLIPCGKCFKCHRNDYIRKHLKDGSLEDVLANLKKTETQIRYSTGVVSSYSTLGLIETPVWKSYLEKFLKEKGVDNV